MTRATLFLCLFSFTAVGQSDTMQWSFGLSIWDLGEAYGHQVPEGTELPDQGFSALSVDIEARKSQRFSYLVGAGVERENGSIRWGKVNVLRDVSAGGDGGEHLRLTTTLPATRNWRRYWLGGGGQLNVRMGSADLSLAGLLSIGLVTSRQTVPRGYRRWEVGTNPNAIPNNEEVLFPVGFYGSSRLVFHSLLQAGGRLSLTHTYWIDAQFALRLSAASYFVGGPTIGTTARDGDQYALSAWKPTDEVARASAQSMIDPTEGDGPSTTSPESFRTRLALGVGIVFKPKAQSR